ncbi:hypothetical protein O181_008329 [Austropuccinia psidii MF-1]|uniref:Isocitrate lyase n=1 Tax=Austropuccinia psidii MF-1 TaxID=1389203 RepID=A0A9Q3BME9_9BASI|nr:hypothetical protein [Austropuccinia psidii MF-1]
MSAMLRYRPMRRSAKPSYRVVMRTHVTSATAMSHEDQLSQLTQSIAAWFQSPRFSNTRRSYSPQTIASKRGSLPIFGDCYANLQARKLLDLLAQAEETCQPVVTMGALDPVQQSQMAYHLPAVYVSGWAASSTFVPGTHEVGPDLADYPYHTVPTAVARLVKAQQLHDRKQWDALSCHGQRSNHQVDYLKPIVADGDNGHGGLSTVMKLAKAFGEAGVAGMHLEDQLVGGKKCGHQAGKVLVPICEHLGRLRAARMQWDIMGLETVLIGRTDAESAKLISSDHDPRDRPFILGAETDGTNSDWITGKRKSLAEEIIEAEERGAQAWEIDQIERKWLETTELMTFDQAVERAFQRHNLSTKDYFNYVQQARSRQLSHNGSLELAMSFLPAGAEKIVWDPYVARTREGYYRFQGGLEAAIQRALHFAEVSDLVWVETKKPDLSQAKMIANRIRERYPQKGLVYNLSPSFNWLEQGFSDNDLKDFVWELGKLGFVFQLISLAGLHSTATITAQLASSLKTEGMLGYVKLIQRKEKEIGCDVLKHQKWSGSEYVDRILSAVSAGSAATAATGEDSTEKTF